VFKFMAQFNEYLYYISYFLQNKQALSHKFKKNIAKNKCH
jgi:hypothetical protein